MVLTLYGSPVSTCTKRKGVPFKFAPIDFAKGEHKAPEYLEKQPFGQVPYLDDDGHILYESRAIARYIAEKYADQGTPLIPKDLKAKSLFEQAASVEQSNFDVFAAPAVFENLFKPHMGLTPNKERFDELIGRLEPKLDVYDKILSKQKYLAGDELTLADLFHIPYAVLLSASGSNAVETRPNVARQVHTICCQPPGGSSLSPTDPSWQTVKDGLSSTA
ncbi:glutathione S-transferase [Coprinellus micaceus]|uniref:glutathione transferase n=1 Tax=Coprinellus micaceus TaxID=71717 RepID=A0A4Y7THK5_COPMI|nr:glutathione S-transferase [Coprinellus micaceus]